jgi:hypothetical protein
VPSSRPQSCLPGGRVVPAGKLFLVPDGELALAGREWASLTAASGCACEVGAADC